MINAIIGNRMKLLRKSLNLTQTEFAHYIPGRIDYTYIGKIERGAQYPSIKMLERIAKSYGVSINYFFGEASGDMEVLFDIKNAVLTWLLRTQDILSRTEENMRHVIRAVLAKNKKRLEEVSKR